MPPVKVAWLWLVFGRWLWLKEAMGGKDLLCHYMVVNDWDSGVDSEQNLVLISIPSVLDPSMAPEGMHALHAYTPATEPYDL